MSFVELIDLMISLINSSTKKVKIEDKQEIGSTNESERLDHLSEKIDKINIIVANLENELIKLNKTNTKQNWEKIMENIRRKKN